MIFDHISLSVTDLDESKAFFLRALEPLGIGIAMEGEGYVGMGRPGRPQFWLGTSATHSGPMHIAFAAESREQVRRFHAAALAAGGQDNGAPGVREHYHPTYYGAFVIGPDGHNVEAVCHRPES
jgi:catechol 2,3-dioxygenase-like lactoylglutathione lyase family enzyme